MTKEKEDDSPDELIRLWTEDELSRLAAEDESLHEQMEFPPLPPLPEAPGDVVAIFIPKKSKSRIARKKKHG